MIRLAAYLRVSEEEHKLNLTIENQRGEVRRWAEYHRHEIVGEYPDDSVSGTIRFEARPSGAKLLTDLASGTFNTVVVWRLDRLGRNAFEILRAVSAIRAAGVKLVSVTEHFDPDTPAGAAFLNLLATFAQFERDSIVQRTSLGKKLAVKGGRFQGGKPPLGFKVAGEDHDRRIEPDAETSAVIRDIFHAYSVGTIPVDIAEYVRLTHGVHLTHWSILRILRDRTYIGDLEWPKRTYQRSGDGRITSRKTRPDERTIIQVEPLVEENLFEEVQEKLTRAKGAAYKRSERFYLLHGLLRCARCGGRLAGTKHSRMRAYYQCTGHLTGREKRKGCPVLLRAEDVEQGVWDHVGLWVESPEDLVAARAAKLDKMKQNETAILSKQVQMLEAALIDYDEQRSRVDTQLIQGRLDSKRADAQLDRIRGEEMAARARLRETKAALDAATDKDHRVRTALEMLRRARQGLVIGQDTPQSRRLVIEQLIRRVDVDFIQVGKPRSWNAKRPVLTIHDRLPL
jgi:site-specific DNA recombinase